MPTAVRKKAGLTVRTFKGLSKKRMESKGGGPNFGIRLNLKPGEMNPLQFLHTPEDFQEFEMHVWRDGNQWNFIPCVGDTCPLCQNEDRDIAKTSYQFAALVYNLKERKAQILTGPKDLAGRIFHRWERKPTLFLKRTYETTKLGTTPVSYDFQVGEDDLVQVRSIKNIPDIDSWLEGELKRYYGEDMPTADNVKSRDDDDDDDEDDDEEEEQEYTLGDLKKMTLKKLRELAEELEVDTEGMDKSDLVEAIASAGSEEEDDEEEEEDDEEEEEDDDEEDEDEEDDEDEEEDEPAPARRTAAAKKAPAKKAVAAKKAAPARRAPARR